jgi:carbamoyl-phosphate synthase large subunit
MNLLLTSVGRRSYLVEYFKKALEGQGKVFVANSTALSPAFLVADESVIVPEIYDPQYIPFLLRYCAEKNIKAIISLFDIDLPILARHKQDFERIGTKVLVSDSDFIDICNDKWKTYQFLRENGFQTPATYLELKKVKRDLKDGELHYPLMVKPRWGMGSIAVYEADNEAELDVFYLKIKRDIEKSYLKYESAQNMEESVLIQEKIDGQEYGMDVINDLEGEYVNTIVKLKRAMRFGETDCAMTVDEPIMHELGERIAQISHHIGNLDVDLFKTQEGECYVLEMNARFGGGYPFSHMAGVNLPQAIVNWLLGKTAEENLFIPKIGVLGQKDIRLVQIEG